MSGARLLGLAGLVALALVPLLPLGPAQEYIWHVIIQIFLWSFVGNAWSLMGRFGLVSLGHGAFLGVGAYATVLLWNFYGMTPWAGAGLAILITVAFALVVAYPCSRFQVVGHYFGLVTLAVGEVIRLLIVAERDWTGGSLGVTLTTGGTASDWWTLQFADKRVFYYVGLAAWLFGSGSGGGWIAAWPARPWRPSARTRPRRPRWASGWPGSRWPSPRSPRA